MFQFESNTKENISGTRIQPKLKIGQPGDKYEQEADAVADRVMRMSESDTMQMQPEEEELMQPKLRMQPNPEDEVEFAQSVLRKQPIEEEEEMMQPKLKMQPNLEDEVEFAHSVLRKQPVKEEEEMLEPKVNSSNLTAPSDLTDRVNSSIGNGEHLPRQTNQFMGNALGTDFSGVQIHTGTDAVQMNRQLGARAFTYKNNIYFNSGEFNPNNSKGKGLLAHELTHVVQQGGYIPVNYIQRDYALEPPNPDAEVRELSQEEIDDAIEFNTRKFNNENEIRNLRDVLGVTPEPAIFDAELIEAIVQFQAENNLDQDGKIGVFTARLIGNEMLGESTLDPSQRNHGIRMLERGIRLYFTGNNYNDGANTSQKLIRFNVDVPQGLNLRDYALVQFISGQILRVPGPANPNVMMYGVSVPFNFANPQVDSVDPDPIYWSDAANRWNYNINGRRFSATDDPGRANHVFNPGDSANLSFRIGVYRVRDLPAATTGNIGRAQPIQSGTWRFSVARDAAGNITHP